MLLFNIRKTRCHFGPRLLYFGYSLYLLALDLSLAIQFQNYTRLSLQILADTMPPVQPVLKYVWVPVPSKDYYLPDYFWTITDYFGLFIPFLLKRLYRADTSPNHWLLFSTKLSLINKLSPISYPCGSVWLGTIFLNSKITTEKYWFQDVNEISPWHLLNISQCTPRCSPIN